MICSHCGKEIADDAKFCNYCGNTTAPQGVSDDSFTEFGMPANQSSPRFGKEYTIGGAPSGTDLLTVKRLIPFWAIGLLCAVQELFLGWFFGTLLCWLLAVWQGKYYEGYSAYEKGDRNTAYNIWAEAKSYKIGYFVVLGVSIVLMVFYAMFVALATSSLFLGFFEGLGDALTY